MDSQARTFAGEGGAQTGGMLLNAPARDPAAGVRAGSVRLVLIASAGHSGSTLLDLLLGNHSAISGAGEMNRLSLYPEERRCGCGETVASCPYWRRVQSQLALALGRQQIRWDETHTDVPPQDPVLDLEDGPDLRFEEGAEAPARLAQGLAGCGIRVPASGRLTHGGVRDRKWRLVGPQSGLNLAIRHDEGRVKVYPPLAEWKNPLRKLPSPIEIALAAGLERGALALGGVSRAARRQIDTTRNSWRVAEAMAAVDGTQFVVDSSKSAVRLKLLYIVRPAQVRVLHLVRDGRAVSASAMRRRDMTAATAARVWKRENQHLALVLRGVPAAQQQRVRYEDVCRDPSGELARICRFLGLEFEPAMRRLWERPVHNIPGNPMLFQKERRDIATDERWRRDLSAGDIRTIEAIAGRMNGAFGYQT